MKNTRRFAAFVASVLAVACMAAPMASSFSASADTAITSGSITITTTETDHTYNAYQIFDGDLSKADDGTITFSNVKWGSGIDSSKTTDLLNKLIAFTASDSTKPFVNCTDAASVATALATISSNTDKDTSTDIDKIATIFATYKNSSATASDSSYSADDGGYKISITDPGYYLVIDTATNSITGLASGEAFSKHILQVAGDATVAAKSSAPTLVKKVEENTNVSSYTHPKAAAADTNYNDVADYDINDVIDFKLYGTLPANYDLYTTYNYVFTDTYDAGLTTIDGDDADTYVDVVVKVDGKVVSAGYTVNEDKTKREFTVTFANLKSDSVVIADNGTITKDSLITVEYQAKLNENAVIGLNGNENKATLTYSNNPNVGGEGDTGTTPEDTVIVFTYELDVTKYLGEGETTKADDKDGTQAGFKLYNSDKSKVATLDANNKITGWVDSSVEANGTEVKTKADGTFSFIGLDDGTYVLRETTTPTGYNTMDDLTLVIDATTANCQDYTESDDHKEASDVLTALTLNSTATTDANKGKVSTDIHNLKGSSLPSTGGMGTTLFYVGGGALVVGAGVLLVTKKRMANK